MSEPEGPTIRLEQSPQRCRRPPSPPPPAVHRGMGSWRKSHIFSSFYTKPPEFEDSNLTCQSPTHTPVAQRHDDRDDVFTTAAAATCSGPVSWVDRAVGSCSPRYFVHVFPAPRAAPGKAASRGGGSAPAAAPASSPTHGRLPSAGAPRSRGTASGVHHARGPGRGECKGRVRTLAWGGVKVRPTTKPETKARCYENMQLPPPNHFFTKMVLTTPSLGTC